MQKWIFYILISIVFTFSFITKKNTKTNDALIDLGRHLFFDQKLSANLAKSCSSCHDPKYAFTDGYKKSIGIYGDEVMRNSPSLLNVKDRRSLTWADIELHDLEKQMLKPIFSTTPPELGAKGNENQILSRFINDKSYKKKFKNAFPKDKSPITFDNIISAISAFQRTLISENAPIDLYRSKKDTNALNPDAKAGMNLFFSDRLSCSTCHNGIHFDKETRGYPFANIGLYYCEDIYPQEDRGQYNHTKDSNDIGAFRIPSLRNIALTAPYFHDGSAKTLREVIAVYSKGGREINYGSCRGNGADSPWLDGRVTKFTLTETEEHQLISFLHSLTDSTIFKNKLYQNPFFPSE